MSLITCPECNKEVSDKAAVCPHCGYPIRTQPYIHEIVNGVDIDLSFIQNPNLSQIQKISKIREVSGCSLFEAKEIVLKYCKANQSTISVPKCPTCGSTNIEKISVGKKMKGNFLFGFLSSDVRNTMHCNNCGYKW